MTAVDRDAPAGTDRQVVALLPTPRRAVPPVTARIRRRNAVAYAVLWLVGLLPSLLGAAPAWSALGLGLVVPGGGLLAAGHPLLALGALGAVGLSVLLWWAMGPTVLPPVVWLGTAAWGAAAADHVDPTARVVSAAVVPALLAVLVVLHRVRHARQARVGARLNERLAAAPFVVTGAPGLDVRVPVAESTPDDLAHLRFALDLALQPLESFEGFDRIDQFREAATRYQLNALGYSLAMAQFTRTPAFTGYLAEAQRNAIEKMLDRRVWGYWALENAWGNLRRDRDPIDNGENIMLTGFHGLLVGMFAALNDDRYRKPGALTYRWDEGETHPHDFSTLAARVHRNVRCAAYTLFPCEPNWIYTVCNTFGMNTLLSHDRSYGTSWFAEVEPALRHAYETEFLRPDGRIIGVRSRHLGLSWNLWAGPSIQLTTAFWMHPALPDIAHRTWWLLRETALRRDDDGPVFPRLLSARLDPGNYRVGRDTYSTIVTLMAARELGDDDWAEAAARRLAEHEPVLEADGARRYADASVMANLYGNLGRFGRRSALRDLVVHGAPQVWRQGPLLAECAYPDVLVAKAVTDGRALDLVLRPGRGPRRTLLRVERLEPHREYEVRGGRDAVVTASATGEALVDIELEDRHELRLAPR
ncbi:MAG: hypothetical protein ACTHMS_19765 [Jatrophihabitans sp.]|uniref:linalool dehydratase/isomerase domain-containing protein n=1 Tax=Jatrophihabitans sp. TaxID=1932789 RepID=UPI003F7D57A5